jgi:hypothetical protein
MRKMILLAVLILVMSGPFPSGQLANGRYYGPSDVHLAYGPFVSPTGGKVTSLVSPTGSPVFAPSKRTRAAKWPSSCALEPC